MTDRYGIILYGTREGGGLKLNITLPVFRASGGSLSSCHRGDSSDSASQ